MWSVAASALVLMCGVALANKALGDLAPPQPLPDSKLIVTVDPNAQKARLILPDEGAFGAPAPPEAPPGADKGAFWSPTRTMMAGLCLSLAIVSLVFVRFTSGGARMLMIGIVGASALGLGAAAWADIPSPFPRPRPQPQPQPINVATKLAEGPVTIEYTGKQGEVRLILTAKSLGGVFRLPPGAPPRLPDIPAPGVVPPPAP
jgi:hypothetical protein